MTMADKAEGVPAGVEELAFRTITGDLERIKATVGPDETMAPDFLTARPIRLADGTRLRQLRVLGTARRAGYGRLDNEILAGLRLRGVTGTADYPPELSRLHGYEAESADPYALLEPYRGQPLTVTGQHLLGSEERQFQVSLLTGLCWLAAAGIAHRGLAPTAVHWDGRHAQITDFSTSTVVGAPREVVGTAPWAAREQRAGSAHGYVSAQDDIWAAGRLIFWVHTREELVDRSQIDERPALKHLLAGVFGPPEDRPSARDLLGRLSQECSVPRALESRSPLDAGRRRFYAERAGKHPGVASAPDAGDRPAPGEPGGAAGKPPDRTAARSEPVVPESTRPADPSKSSRRLLRRFPLLMMVAAGVLNLLRIPIAIALVLVR